MAESIATANPAATRTLYLTGTALVLANLIPLAGVLFFGWSVFELILLFWTENLIIGALYIARFVTIYRLRNDGSLLFYIPFFCFHFGTFCLVHLMFVLWMFRPEDPASWSLLALVIPFAILVVSHVLSFKVNFIAQGGYRQVGIEDLMIGPYRRVAVLHVVILVGGGLTQWLGEPLVALLILITGKIAIDFGAHLREYRIRAGQIEAPIPADRISEKFEKEKFPGWDD
jgi:hypothetical protein